MPSDKNILQSMINSWKSEESIPRLSMVKRLAALIAQGICLVEGSLGNERIFLSMGTVKDCNDTIIWDSEAMERGEPWA